jgi:hypothetical protein
MRKGLAGKSATGTGNRQADFPIEEYYPNVQVKNGYIPRGSKAFILWRQKTASHIPDSAFNYHYMTNERIAEEIGGMVNVKKTQTVVVNGVKILGDLHPDAHAMLEKYYADPSSKQLALPTSKKVRPVAIEKYGSPQKMFEQIGITLELTDARLRNILSTNQNEVRFIIDANGKVYAWTEAESLKIKEALGGSHDVVGVHQNVFELIEHSNPVGDGAKASFMEFGSFMVKDGKIINYKGTFNSMGMGINGNDFLKLQFEEHKNNLKPVEVSPPPPVVQ